MAQFDLLPSPSRATSGTSPALRARGWGFVSSGPVPGVGGVANQKYLLLTRFARNLDPSAYASDCTRKLCFSLAIMRRRALCSRVSWHDGFGPHRPTSSNVGSCWLTLLRPFVRSLIRRNISQQCWESLRRCWQWCANGCDNS